MSEGREREELLHYHTCNDKNEMLWCLVSETKQLLLSFRDIVIIGLAIVISVLSIGYITKINVHVLAYYLKVR